MCQAQHYMPTTERALALQAHLESDNAKDRNGRRARGLPAGPLPQLWTTGSRTEGWEAAAVTKETEAGVHLSTLTGHQTAPHQDLSKPTGPGAATALSQTQAPAPHATGAAGLVQGCSRAGEAGWQGAPSRLSFSKPTTC